MREGAENGLTLSKHVDNESIFNGDSVAADLFMRLLYSKGGIKEGRKAATVVDLRTLAGGLQDDQIISAAATQLGTDIQGLKVREGDDAHNKEVEKLYKRINNALDRSKQFIREELKLPLPDEIVNTRVHTPQELLSLLKKTTAFKQGKGGLDRHLAYCALIKGALAALELETRYASELEKEAEYLEDIITTQRPENSNTPLVITKPYHRDEKIEGTLSSIEPPCDVSFETRDKTWQSIMRKFMSKPDSSAAEAYKDEIAFRFRLDGRRMGTVARVLGFFKRNFEARAAMITNKGAIGQEEFSQLFSKLKTTRGNRGLKEDPASNPKSARGFSVLQVTGSMRVPPGGNLAIQKRYWRERSFEIQFVDEARKPLTGLASDAVYALKKDVAIATRLFGGFEEEWFLQHAIPASLDDTYTNMKPPEILRGLVEQGYLFKKPGTRNKYAATSVWDNWLKIRGLIVPEDIRAKVSYAVNNAMKNKQRYAEKELK